METLEDFCEVKFNPDKSLTIKFEVKTEIYGGFINSLFDALGDHDIITVPEINNSSDFLLLSDAEDLYYLNGSNCRKLEESGEVTLEYAGELFDFIEPEENLDFMRWLRGNPNWKYSKNRDEFYGRK